MPYGHFFARLLVLCFFLLNLQGIVAAPIDAPILEGRTFSPSRAGKGGGAGKAPPVTVGRTTRPVTVPPVTSKPVHTTIARTSARPLSSVRSIAASSGSVVRSSPTPVTTSLSSFLSSSAPVSSPPATLSSTSLVTSRSILASSSVLGSSSVLAASSIPAANGTSTLLAGSATLTSSTRGAPTSVSSANATSFVTLSSTSTVTSSSALNGTETATLSLLNSTSTATPFLPLDRTLTASSVPTNTGGACAFRPRSSVSNSLETPREYIPANSTHTLVTRANPLFLGWHGTQNQNAQLFESVGIMPPQFGSGANGELGQGLYVTDDLVTAKAFAQNAKENVNRQQGKGKPNKDPTANLAFVCKIFARDATEWINSIPKQWFPKRAPNGQRLIGDDVNNQANRDQFETARRNFARGNGLPGAATGAFVRFAPLDVDSNSAAGQFAIPTSLQALLIAKCFPVDDAHELTGFQESPELSAGGPINYRQLIGPWNIVPSAGCS